MKKILLIIISVISFTNLIESYPFYGNVYIHPKTGHKIGLLGDEHVKINKIYKESNFLNSFMPYLKYILSSKDLNLKLIVEGSYIKKFSEEFYKTNEKLGYLDFYDKFNNRQGMSLILYLCFTENHNLFRHLCNYFGLGDLKIKNEAIECDLRKSSIFCLARLMVEVMQAKLKEGNEDFDEKLNLNPKFLINWSKSLMVYLLETFDLPFNVENLLKNLSELIYDFEYNALHSKDLNERKIWLNLKTEFDYTILYINEIIKNYNQLNSSNKNLIKGAFGVDENTPLNEIPLVLIFVIPRLLNNNLNLMKETRFINTISVLTTDAGFFKEICNQARINNNCLLLLGATHCINLENWLLRLGYIKLYNCRSVMEFYENHKEYSFILQDDKQRYYFPCIGNEFLQNIMSELLGKEKAEELSIMKSDILQYDSSLLPHLKLKDNLNNTFSFLAGAGIGLAAIFGLGKIISSLKYS